MPTDSKNTTQKGREAEDYACTFLEKRGFTIIERNFHTRFGELDIIAKKADILHFIEVKSGLGFEPIYNLNPKKLERLTKSIHMYLAQKSLKNPYCLSALILSKSRDFTEWKVEFIENLTLF